MKLLRQIALFAAVTSLAVMLAMPCAAATQFPNPNEKTDLQEGDFQYSVNLDGTATIRRYIGDTDIVSLDFPSTIGGRTVTMIGEYDLAPPMLSDCHALETVTFPETMTSLGNVTFCKTAVTQVVFPENTVYCGYNANFGGSPTVGSVVLPKVLDGIAEYYFEDCAALREVTIYEECTIIGQYAFDGCEALSDVYYGGTKAQWDQMTVKQGNEPLMNAWIHYINGSGVAGDVSADGVVTVQDALRLYQATSAGTMLSAGDLDGDGVITMRDVMQLYHAVAS